MENVSDLSHITPEAECRHTLGLFGRRAIPVFLMSLLPFLSGCYEITEGGSAPQWSPDGSKIAFVLSKYDRANKSDIWVIDADGSHPKNLTNNVRTHFSSQPDWSPDGSSIAYVADLEGSSDIWLMDSDGNNHRNLTHSPAADLVPSWSPDGKQIAFSSYPRETGLPEIWVIDAGGDNMKKLTGPIADRHPAFPPEPVWSPDATKIIFAYTQDTSNVWMVNADGSDLKILLEEAQSPAWSPDGSRIAYASGQRDKSDIWVTSADGDNPVRLTNNGASGYPVWSTDGGTIFFLMTSSEAYGIWAMDSDGSDARILDSNKAMSPIWFRSFGWSPDRSQIAYVSSTRPPSLFSTGRYDIWVTNIDGTGLRKITN